MKAWRSAWFLFVVMLFGTAAAWLICFMGILALLVWPGPSLLFLLLALVILAWRSRR